MKKKAISLSMIIRLLTFLLFASTACGGGYGNGDLDGTNDADRDESAIFEIDSMGGTINLPNVASIEFPAGAFENRIVANMREIDIDEATLNDYEMSGVMFRAGEPHDRVLVVDLPLQPRREALIRFTVPSAFREQLDSEYVPTLFMKFFQGGASEEEIDSFEPFISNPRGDVLTAPLSPGLFTNARPESEGMFRAVILLGSRKVRNSASLSNSAPFFLSATSSNSCSASIVGNPLERELELTSEYGFREDPILHVQVEHRGVDFRANTGDNVLAVSDAVVEQIGYSFNTATGKGYGRFVVLFHADGSSSRYAHLVEGSTNHLQAGMSVLRGAIIGKADTTGGATGPHLHFELARDGNISDSYARVDPYPCIKLPVTIVSINVGDALFHPVYGVPFEIDLHVPENNYVARRECLIDGGSESEYFCWAVSPCSIFDYDGSPDRIQGCISFSEPRGAAAATYRITDQYGNVSTAAISASWDCCDDTSEAFYLDMPLSCFTLGDMSSQCH